MATVIKSKKKQKQEPIEFQVPNELKLSPIHVKRIAIENDSFVIQHDRLDKLDDENPHDHIRFQITGNYEEDMNSLRMWAKSSFFFIDNPDFMIDQLVSCVGAIYTTSNEAVKAIAKIKSKSEQQLEEAEEKEEAKLKKQYIQKYHAKSENVLYESVLASGKPYFVNQEWDSDKRAVCQAEREITPSTRSTSNNGVITT